jgi:NAD(P)-dependent dehydrogenase (short-subunit alcohol dehydrogenase family)
MNITKVAFITGGADGLGSGAGKRLVDDGWNVLLFDINPLVIETAKNLNGSSSEGGGSAIAIVGDVTKENDLSEAFAFLEKQYGRLDLVVANAGIGGKVKDLFEVDITDFRAIIDVNLIGVYLTCKFASKKMREAKSGSIVITSSIFGVEPVKGAGAYCASKAAVIALSKSLALELAAFGVRVNNIAPGYMHTEMQWQAIRDKAEVSGRTFEDERQNVVDFLPLGRHGEPSDYGAAVAFLASNDSSYITGNTLGVTGGVVRW